MEHADYWNTGFVYDGRVRLRQRVEYTSDGSVWIAATETRYVYDGWRVIQERDSNNVPTVSYTRGTDLSGSLEGAGGIGGLLSRTANSQLPSTNAHAFYHADGNGNVTYLVNSSQTLAASYRYDAYGNTLSSSGALAAANVYRFSSKELHVNSGLYYYGERFYSPNLQRWSNRDPYGEVGFGVLRQAEASLNGAGPNLYAFVHNNPLNEIDAIGLKSSVGDTIDDIWDKLPDSVKDKIKDYLGGKLLKDGKEACDKLKCMSDENPSKEVTCQMCAVYECAKKLPKTALALKNCLDAKFVNCALNGKP